jgi:hypothetical protein
VTVRPTQTYVPILGALLYEVKRWNLAFPGFPPRAAAKAPRPARKPAGAKPAGAKAAAKTGARAPRTSPAGVRPSAATRAASSKAEHRPAQSPEGIELVGTAIQAAGELAQLGLTLGTKALRGAVSRIPRP